MLYIYLYLIKLIHVINIFYTMKAITLTIIISISLLSLTNSWGNRNRQQQEEEKKDLYKLLELTKRATQEEIKSQYRKLTRKYHPDKKDGNKELYTEINEAYEILSDPNKRRIYDTRGYAAAKKADAQQDEDEGGIFSSFFGDRMKRENKMEDQRIRLRVTLSDLYNGKEYQYKYTRNIICPHCRGSGAESDNDIHTCNKCNGQGVILERQQIAPGFIQQFQKECPKCGGKGKTITKGCHVCQSNKIVPSIEEMSVYVEKGMNDGQEIVSIYK